jgi:hypothetical protein
MQARRTPPFHRLDSRGDMGLGVRAAVSAKGGLAIEQLAACRRDRQLAIEMGKGRMSPSTTASSSLPTVMRPTFREQQHRFRHEVSFELKQRFEPVGTGTNIVCDALETKEQGNEPTHVRCHPDDQVRPFD